MKRNVNVIFEDSFFAVYFRKFAYAACFVNQYFLVTLRYRTVPYGTPRQKVNECFLHLLHIEIYSKNMYLTPVHLYDSQIMRNIYFF